MRAVIQRVSEARVQVEGEIVGEITDGLLVLLGVTHDDDETDAAYLAKKTAGLRIFEHGDGKMNLSVTDIAGQVLVVSQFTLFGDCRKGRRPSFVEAARPVEAEALYERFLVMLADQGLQPQRGVFGAHMQVEIHNDGPVTLIVESPQ